MADPDVLGTVVPSGMDPDTLRATIRTRSAELEGTRRALAWLREQPWRDVRPVELLEAGLVADLAGLGEQLAAAERVQRPVTMAPTVASSPAPRAHVEGKPSTVQGEDLEAGEAVDRLRALLGRTKAKAPRLPRPLPPRCGARTRKGAPCVAAAIPGPGRCRNHGGCSTGPRTPDGLARALACLRRGNAPMRLHP